MPRTAVRPGLTIKAVLSGQRPLLTRGPDRAIEVAGIVDRASVTELYRHYKIEILRARENALNRLAFNQRGMSYLSFCTYFWRLRTVGFVVEVERGDPVYSSTRRPDAPLLRVPTAGRQGSQVELSTPIRYALTPEGQAAEGEWMNISKAVREMPRAAPAVEEVEAIQEPVPAPPLPTRWTRASVPRLLSHLEALQGLAEEHEWPDTDWPNMENEIARLADAVRTWLDAAETTLERAEGTSREDEAQERVDAQQELLDALDNQDLETAVDRLRDWE